MKKTGIALAALALAAAAAPIAFAHHSAVQYDFTKQAIYKGKVKKFEPINPHMLMVLTVTDAKGARDIGFEGHSTNNMYRNGYRNGMIKVGDTISVTAAPYKNGVEGGFVLNATTQDGRFFGARGSSQDPAALRRAAEGRQP